MLQFVFPVRVYYEDTDAGGVVYHASYLRFFERARVESLREIGVELKELLSGHKCQFVVRAIETDFLRPARLDQLLCVVTQVLEVRHASIRYHQKVYLDSTDGLLICSAKVWLVCLDPNWRPMRVPGVIIRGLKK